MNPLRRLLPGLMLAVAAYSQLTPDQRVSEFLILAGSYSKHYAPYEWKKTLFQFDLLDAKPWLERIAQVKDDLEYYDICMEYVSKLNDTHVNFTLPSTFTASLGFTVDVFDGKVLVDSINRTLLPAAQYRFQIGDELMSVDGKEVEFLLQEFARYAGQGNPRSSRRVAAGRIVSRPQSRMPRAPELGDTARVIIRHAAGDQGSYLLPWRKSGRAFTAGPVPSPKSRRRTADADDPSGGPGLLRQFQTSYAGDLVGVLNNGSRTPVFAMPEGFQQRLGRASADVFYSGAYQSGDYRIGFIRIPSYTPADRTAAVRQFETEMAYFQQNTDGLVIDQMRNPGGNLCYGEDIVARLVSTPFRATLFEIRATWSWITRFQSELDVARAMRQDAAVIDAYQRILEAMLTAYNANRGRTTAVPICGNPLDERQPAKDRDGKTIAYTKPIVMLIDEFSLSTGDSVPSMLQDAGRVTLFGWRTNGAGGTNTTVDAGIYSETTAGMTLGLMTRKGPVVTPDYPTSSYIENVGVRPDIEYDYMTRDNLLQNGKPFQEAFTKAIVEAIKKQPPA